MRKLWDVSFMCAYPIAIVVGFIVFVRVLLECIKGGATFWNVVIGLLVGWFASIVSWGMTIYLAGATIFVLCLLPYLIFKSVSLEVKYEANTYEPGTRNDLRASQRKIVEGSHE